MNSQSLQDAFDHYQITLDYLALDKFTKEQALEILLARDKLQKRLEAKSFIPVGFYPKLIEKDIGLKKQAYKIVQVLDLPEYRDTLPISSQAWWWNLESRESLHPCNRYDWLFRAVKLVLLGVNFTLIGTIATRFFSSGSGLVEIGGFIFSTFISLLQAQNALTQARSKSFVKLMNSFKIREHLYEEVQLSTTVIIFIILLVIWTNFSFFSELYNQQGKQLQDPPREGQEFPNLALAEKKYLKAIELDDDNSDAHYKLATLYEELQDFDNAKKQYVIAAKAGFLDAYNNLAYRYIRENKNAEAVELLNQGIKLIQEKEQKLEKPTDTEKKDLYGLKYSMYKNLGWARFKQGRDEDAEIYLGTAKRIVDNNQEMAKSFRNPGAVYCIYAQLLEKEQTKAKKVQSTLQTPEIRRSWQECRKWNETRLAAGETLNPEEDEWLYLAKQKLQ